MSMDEYFKVSFSKVSVRVKSSKLNPFRSGETKEILKHVCGEFRSHELTGIIGTSGSGKSTLLDALSGFRNDQRKSGFIAMNDSEKMSARKMKNISSYIMQDQLLHEYLTVGEVMLFSFNMKNNRKLDEDEKNKQIMDVLMKFSIMEKCDTLVKNLSGGEKKRLSIAVELLDNPKIIFLDEPTTGLDSASSLQCIKLLKALALEGRAVICTIHQPSALMINIFDHIYALAEGNCIYQGSAEKIVQFLSVLQLDCPETYTPTDFLIEISNSDDIIIGMSHDSVISSLKNESDNGSNQKYFHHRKSRNLVKLPSKHEHSSTFLWQVYYLMLRSAKIALRDKTLIFLRLSIHLFVGILFGYIYQNVGSRGADTFDNYRYLVVSVVFLLYTSYHSKFVSCK